MEETDEHVTDEQRARRKDRNTALWLLNLLSYRGRATMTPEAAERLLEASGFGGLVDDVGKALEGYRARNGSIQKAGPRAHGTAAFIEMSLERSASGHIEALLRNVAETKGEQS